MSPKRRAAHVVFQGLEAGLRMFRWVVVVLLVLFLFSGITTIEPDTVGLLLRFGKLQGATPGEQVKQPGLLVALPFPIDQVRKVPGREKEGEVVIDEVWKELNLEVTTDEIDPVLEGYCLTGDNNILQAKIVVKYRVTDPVAFDLWTYKDEKRNDGELILRDVVLASLVQTLAGWKMDDALRLQRPDPATGGATQEQLAETVWKRAQQRLDVLAERGPSRGSGITISALEFKENHPPRHVLPEFLRVQDAKNNMQTLEQQAKGFANREVPNAEARRDGMVKGAMALEETIVSGANADVSEFKDLYEEYKKSPTLVWQRIYVETVEEVLEKVKKHFVPPGARVILQENGETQP